MRKHIIGALFVFSVVAAVAHAQKSAKPRRALPPKWDRDVVDTFFPDARKVLVGERPVFGTSTSVRPTPMPNGGDPPPTSGGVFAWSKLISPETIEDEIKGQNTLVQQTVTTPGPFKGGGFKKARKQFSTLAVMFAIAGEYDGDVRWQKDSPSLRDMFGRAGMNCKVGTDQSYNEAKLRKQDLADIVRGERPSTLKKAEPKSDWGQVAHRPPLMNRMEVSFQSRLAPWLANKGEFSKNIEKVYHEAQVLAALGEVITREGYEYWDDEDYVEYAHQLRDAAVGIADAVKTNNYEAARTAAGNISKSCSECHEGYRG